MTSPSLLPSPHASPRVLVVDDQPANVQWVGAMLGTQGYEIVPACDGQMALKRMALRSPDLVLLDVLMPDMDGLEVCRRIRESPEWNDIPIIFLSAAGDKEIVVRALEVGGVDYVTKPFHQAELVSRVRTHIALKTARDGLKQLAEDKDELLGILTHDLKNHLGGIQLSAQVLHGRMVAHGDDKLAGLCENIRGSCGQLLAFVKEFLANSAAERGFVPRPERVKLSEAILSSVQEQKETAARKDLVLRTSLPEEDPAVCVDRNALRQVLDNLLSNAIKFSPPGKEISISVLSDGALVQCAVADQGPGFTLEDQRQMFRRYGRLSARPTGGEPSTGLGLSIVKKLVQAMNGELICESTAGAGAKFVVRLRRDEFAQPLVSNISGAAK